MNMNKTLFVLLLSTQSVFAQIGKTHLLTDTSIALGSFNKKWFLKETKDHSGKSILVKKGTEVLIAGYNYNYYNVATKYYEVVYNNKLYYADINDIATDSTYLSQMQNMKSAQLDSFKANAFRYGKKVYDKKVKDIKSFIEKAKSKGIVVLQVRYYKESKFREGTSAQIKFLNPTSKIIQGVWVYFEGYDPNGAKIKHHKTDQTSFTPEYSQYFGCGYLTPGGSCNIRFPNIWKTDGFKNAKLTSITIQYKDGSIKTILKPEEVMLNEKFFDIAKEMYDPYFDEYISDNAGFYEN
jgi:hypothetical protein